MIEPSSVSNDIVISVVNASKAYGIPYSVSPIRALRSLREGAKAFRRTDMTLAVSNVSLTVPERARC